MEWQPIETAPKDGTWILTWTNLGGHDDEYMAMHYKSCDGWCGGSYTFLQPTHWMPLPEPPVEQ